MAPSTPSPSRTVPRISETEWEIMRVVWGRSPITAADIIAELTAQDPTWHPVTAKTLLNRLVRKGALGFEQQGRAYLYRPLVDEQACITAVTRSFLDRVFGGSLGLMVAHFVDQKGLTAKQARELRKAVEEI
ncbi:MAG: BlaI/MecI/CopY family transcriptional regulator [Verrucomicrobia bacterium]|nr:BlaI/MecI/CopY family transcriptional regulator [Verrucomicrobiota bacterium]